MRDEICLRCGVRCSKYIWQTHTAGVVCTDCYYSGKGFRPEEDGRSFNRCLSCNISMDLTSPSICSSCVKDRCSKHRNHMFVMEEIKAKQRIEMQTCTDCKYWLERNPKDWYDFFFPKPLTDRQKRIKELKRHLFDFGEFTHRDGESFIRKKIRDYCTYCDHERIWHPGGKCMLRGSAILCDCDEFRPKESK